MFCLHYQRHCASEYQLLEIAGEQSAVVLVSCLQVTYTHQIGQCEKRKLDEMGHHPDTVGSYVLFYTLSRQT